jgi:hypothetical protein
MRAIDSVDGTHFHSVGFSVGSIEITADQLDESNEFANLIDSHIARIERKIQERIDRRVLNMLERQARFRKYLADIEKELMTPMKFDPIPEDFSMYMSYRYTCYQKKI